MCRRRMAASASGRASPVGTPQTRTVPLVGVNMQPRMDSRVVLPLPEGPTRTVNSWARTTRSSARTASTRVGPCP